MNKILDGYCRLLELVIVLALVVMVVLVFGNVVLRYVFNSGITESEEISRWAFVWMTFLGAIVAVRDGGHLGTDMLVSRLGNTGKKICLAVAEMLMLYACWLIYTGSLAQTKINIDVEAPVTGWSMGWISGIGIVFAVSAALFHLMKLGRLFTGRLREEELVVVQESEDLAKLKADAGDKP
ncbi:Tripartite ATP-independent periplasmic transporter DctQ component [Rubrivivax sp. A210]|uniref:TRAP transporter small permease n=1 Tax=Rubrivivax sp. A210 TaxID=2772301 RepID=UPI00191A9953|nr:TRAP transporter small permease [Rubrivivax sp. A210]CAD5375156.1 Tripartite ATP-independent periplasmic transporter DctQ component [Rubrivivax sp. A210]